MKPYACYIGRWQTLHPGHLWLFRQQLNEGTPILIMIRDMKKDENNTKTAIEVEEKLQEVFYEEIDEGMVRTMIIPDISSFNYGRKVGYDVVEHVPPDNIGEISGTDIRGGLMQKVKQAEDGLWGDYTI